MVSAEQLKQWLKRPEGLNLEFKEAKNQFSHDKDLPDYCAALSNEGGGKLILGIDNKGNIVGTQAFAGTHNQLSHDILQKLEIRVDVEELHYEGQRVLVFHVPPRPWIGRPVKSTGNYTYPMRAGESLVEMDEQTLRGILNEGEPDFSEQIVPGLTIADLNIKAIDNFKKRWAQKSNRDEYLQFPIEKLLRSIGSMTDKGLNYASLVLFGSKEKIDELIPGSEIIFEWRHDQAKTAHDFRINWREPFFAIYDDIWNAINARNIRFPFQEGLFQREVYAFNEKAIREALLNAVAHRDYRISGQSIFIKASPQEFFIESPGGFPQGITPDNILEKSYWRNRRIAEILEKAELVERAGQGMNDIFESSIREGKGVPNFQGSDAYSVVLRIPAQVKDRNFILFLEKAAKEKQIILSFEEIFELEKVRDRGVVENAEFRNKFVRLGLIEQVGRTRGAKYILSHHYYQHTDKTGVHTRLKGLSREQKKELVLNHLKTNKKGVMKDFKDAFTDMNRVGINNLFQELKKAGKIEHIGSKRQGYWILKGSKTI
jgi:ATP-dependent DNA helicase RecG